MDDTLQPRKGHSSTAIRFDPRRTEVIMFGGHGEGRILGDTTVLQFSEWSMICIMAGGKEREEKN